MSHRIEQAASTLQRVISSVLARRIADPRIVGMISVTRVEVSPDRRHAGVFVSILPEQYEQRAIKGLQQAAVHIQHLVRKEVAMRIVPHLEFKLDRTLKKQAEIFQSIDRALGEGDDHTDDHTNDHGEGDGGDHTNDDGGAPRTPVDPG